MLFLAILPAMGCADNAPMPLERVRGIVTYKDGSLIQADQIRILFEPQDIAPAGKVAPRAAEVYADVSTGKFLDATTWKHGDGALIGRHKVTVVALRANRHGTGDPTTAVPRRYHLADSTPLEVTVTDGGENNFKLVVAREK